MWQCVKVEEVCVCRVVAVVYMCKTQASKGKRYKVIVGLSEMFEVRLDYLWMGPTVPGHLLHRYQVTLAGSNILLAITVKAFVLYGSGKVPAV
jgi:hypothetical protein